MPRKKRGMGNGVMDENPEKDWGGLEADTEEKVKINSHKTDGDDELDELDDLDEVDDIEDSDSDDLE